MRHFETIKTFILDGECKNFEHVYIIGVQHLLETTGSLIEKIIDDGVIAKNVFLAGKIYSTNSDVKRKLKLIGVNIVDSNIYHSPGFFKESLIADVHLLWTKLRERLPSRQSKIIILDDGGYTLKSIPIELLNSHHQIIGIEQTSSGIWDLNDISIPVINVAQSATKIYLEPFIVQQALIKKISDIINKVKVSTIGVISCGAIGNAIINYFSKNMTVHIYDVDSKKMEQHKGSLKHKSALSLYKSCNIIISCTGRDVSDLSWILNTNQDKLLISASSGDVEFLSLIKTFSGQNKQYYPLNTLRIEVERNAAISIFRGGTVANFDGSPHSAPTNEIQLTRGLLYAAFVQACELPIDTDNGLVKLDAEYQKEVVKLWFDDQPQMKNNYSSTLIYKFQFSDWILQKS